MKSYIATAIYQNRCGEICALVEDCRDGSCVYRLIENIERIPYSPEDIAEEVERGFDGFASFDPYEHGGYSFSEVAWEISDGGDYRLIAEFCDNVSKFDPESMNDAARALLLPKEHYYEKIGAAPAEECQLCFFAA